MTALLDIQNLKTYFNTYRGVVKAVDGVSLYVDEKEIIGVVGESGCGKSVTMLSAMQLIPVPPGKIVDGRCCSKARICSIQGQGRGDARHPRRQDRDGLPGAHDLAQPGADDQAGS